MEKVKWIVTLVLAGLIIFGIPAVFFILPDDRMSVSERRLLAQAPELTAEGVWSGTYMKDLERYLLDQFPERDGFRTLNALLRFYGFRQKDVNGYSQYRGHLLKREYPMKENQVLYAANKLKELNERYFAGMKVYYAVVPDKNYFAAEAGGFLSLDYNEMLSMVHETVDGMTYIDIFDCLELDDYYRTDSHWRQEKLFPVVSRLAAAMGAEEGLTPPDAYGQRSFSPFYGTFYGQAALPVQPDTLVTLTHPQIENAVVQSIELPGDLPVYDDSKFEGPDGYDVFLSGAQAIMTIEGTGPEGRELILFRDSFGSSIAPLFIGAYEKITLIDLRYVSSELLPQFIEFGSQDVLFLYSVMLVNNGMLLK